jgi:hypothetical protein
VCLGAFTANGFASSPTPTETSRYCSLIGLAAGSIASRPDVNAFDIIEAALYISDRTAFDFTETKSRISEVAKNADLLNVLTPAELAGHTYFWCAYDKLDVEPGNTTVFEIERNAIKRYQTMFP